MATQNGQEQRLRHLLHLQEHGAGADLSHHRAEVSDQDPNHRILARQKSRFTHDYFYIRDEVLGPFVMRVATFFPFQTTYYLNGHSFIEQELNRAKITFRKNDNAFLAVDDVAALQAAADKLSPAIIRERLDYWTFILGPKFSDKERKKINLSRFYSIAQIEYCRNFIFKRHFPIHKLFERSCELGLWRLTSHNPSCAYSGSKAHVPSVQCLSASAASNAIRSFPLASDFKTVLALSSQCLSKYAAAITLTSCLWKSFRRSRTPFRDRPETVRLHRGTGVRLHPGILFGLTPECRSESSRNRVHLAPDSPLVVPPHAWC